MPFTRGGEAGELYLLGELIGDARRKAGLTQQDLAEEIGRAKITISQWELGFRAPGLLDLMRIARACKTELSTLVAPLDHFDPPPAVAEEPPKKKRKRALGR